jgi:hypothetical protein
MPGSDWLHNGWRKSTFCTDSGCVEIAFASAHVLIRDSQDADGTLLVVSTHAWSSFLELLRALPN